MTGAYLRVKRGEEWKTIEVEYLTDDEREELLSKDDRLIHWLHLVCSNLVIVEKALNRLTKVII